MSFLSRFFYGDHATSRIWLFTRLFLLTLALDIVVLMLEHGGRYGAAGFNVAHFAWLDALVPLPTPALYVGVLLAGALLALTMFFAGANPFAASALFLLYTFAWSMSLLDTFQHHYFLSLVLFCLIFISAPARSNARLAPNWGFSMLGVSVMILYVYTALAKLDAEWLSGETLSRIGRNTAFADVLAMALRSGLSEAKLWSIFAVATIAMEIAIGLAYLFAVTQDWASRSTLVRIATTLGAILAIVLHAGTLGMNLEIGWFAAYMLVLAASFFLPASVLDSVHDALTAIPRLARPLMSVLWGDSSVGRLQKVFFALLAIAVFAVLAPRFDLPGATEVCILAAAVSGALVAVSLVAPKIFDSRSISLASAASGAIVFAAVSLTTVRWDYYRYLGGDYSRRDELDSALVAYEKSELYAPRDSSRKRIIEQLKQQTGR